MFLLIAYIAATQLILCSNLNVVHSLHIDHDDIVYIIGILRLF